VALDENKALVKGLPSAFVGKLLPEDEAYALAEEDDEADDGGRVIGGKPLPRDLRGMVFGMKHDSLEMGEIVLVPRSRGGFTYGRIFGKQSVVCSISDRPKHLVPGFRILLSEDAEPGACLRKDLAIEMLGRLPTEGVVKKQRSFPSMRLTASKSSDNLAVKTPMSAAPTATVCEECESVSTSSSSSFFFFIT